jgi:signal transduction histidine kinase/CheY-like chemotaxis protein/Tfp pilus assembly protein PilF
LDPSQRFSCCGTFSMMSRFSTFIVIGFLLFTRSASSQSRTIDSLHALLNSARDTTRVNLLNKLSSAHWYLDAQKTIDYGKEAVQLARALNFKKGLTSAYNNTGVGYYQQNKYEQAIEWYTKALEMHRELRNYKGEGWVLSNIGLIYGKQGAHATAVEYYLQSLQIWDKYHEEIEKASVFDNIGNVYNDQEEYDLALENYFKARKIQKKLLCSGHDQSMTLSNIGTAYLGKKNYREALKYFLESLTLLTVDEKESRAVSLSNIGLAYIELRQPDSARAYLGHALSIQKETEDKDGMVHTLLGLAEVSKLENNLDAGLNHANEALATARAINDKPTLAAAWQLLAELAEKQGDYKSAYTWHINSVNARDSIRATENIYQIASLQAGFETQKKQAEIEHLRKSHQQQSFRRNAMAVGLLALLVIAGLIVSRQRLKIKQQAELVAINQALKQQSLLLEEQAAKLRETDQLKSAFFANISHEFRTPLTLILNGLSDKMRHTKTYDDERDDLSIMYRNAKRLLNLINQLLDLSKLDSGHMKLSLSNVNLDELLNMVSASFSSLGHSRNIQYTFTSPGTPIVCRLDTDKTEKIFFNLLSNAFKFTPVGGSISFSTEVRGHYIESLIRDSGRGIPDEQLQQVFERFYQGKQYYSDEQGTGIGLALTKELVELHGGKIWAENRGQGACFIVQLPLVPVNEAEVLTSLNDDLATDLDLTSPGVAETLRSANDNAKDENRPTILIAEDSEDLRQYIKKHLIDYYDVIETANGKEALKKSLAQIPDLVISDWMMPEMDGIGLCHALKTDEKTSHIPVILLTALAGEETKYKGLETGADDYLTKPFDNRELLIRIKNLIDNRKALRERFSRELHLGPKKVQVKSMDEKFLEKVMEAIENYMGDADFSMEKFGQQVGLSRMQLHRKLKALTGESPGDFLRSMRLQRAHRLIQSKAGNVSEVAYEVGFNNLSYFSKCFREKFGYSPNEAKPGAVVAEASEPALF